MNLRMQALAAVLASSALVVACGSGGGTTPGMGGTVSGTVVKGPVGGASVTAFAITGGSKGGQVGSASTDPSGNFAMSVGDYTGPIMIEAHGGTYTDEATGATMPMQSADDMVALVPSVAGGATEIRVTPLTTMAGARARSMGGGMTPANITAANTGVGTYFSVSDILHVMPMDPTVAGSTGSVGQDARNYGMVLAAMSQYAKTIGMTTSSSGIVTAMAEDASDGVMDGMMASSTISMAGMGGMMGGAMSSDAGAAGLSTAMAAFIGSVMNRAGVTLTDMQALITQLATSGGQLGGAGGGVPQGTMSGSAFMGAMTSGTVTAYAVSGGAMGAQLGTAGLDGSGHFTVSLGGYSGPVMLKVTDGSFMDPVTGTTMTMAAGDVLTSCVPSFDPGAPATGIQITPLTSMAQAMAQGMAGGMTAGNVTAANAAVGSYFMAGDIVTTSPMDSTVSGSTQATSGARNAGMTIAAMSEYAKTIGMTGSSSAMMTAMTEDASDGVMNGMMGSTAISMAGMGGMMGGGMMASSAGTTGLATAMSTFVSSPMNRSGVSTSDMQTLVDRLAASSGTIQ